MDYNYTTTYADEIGLAALFGGVFFFFFLIGVVTTIIMIAAHWKMFQKAGKNGWEAVIPIYNLIVLFQITKTPMWMLLLLLVPFVGLVVPVILAINTAKAYGKDTSFAILLIFLPIVGYPILGFGDARYIYDKSVNNQNPIYNQTPTQPVEQSQVNKPVEPTNEDNLL